MKLKLRDSEINLTKEEAEQIGNAVLAGAEFLKIGNEIINAKYVIGIFEGGEPVIQASRLIAAPIPEGKDLKKITEILTQMKQALQDKGIIKSDG